MDPKWNLETNLKDAIDIFLSCFVRVWFQSLQKVLKFFFKEDGYCRIPIRHFFSQSRRLLTKIFESVTTVNEKCRCL